MQNGVLPWSHLMHLAAGKGVAPAAFWALSLCELIAFTGSKATPVLRRADFQTLMQQYPDKETRP